MLKGLVTALSLEQHVTFHGFSDDVHSALRQSAVYLSSSLSEGIALTLLEAMAASLPVVATAVGGTPEVVVEGVTGRLVPPRRPDLFAAAVIELLRDPAAASRMGEAGRQRVIADFSLDSMVEQYRRLYEAA